MPLITSRIPFTPENPYRLQRPDTEKIIFLSCEGSVTEEEYFQIVTDIFSEIRSRIKFIPPVRFENTIFTDIYHWTTIFVRGIVIVIITGKGR